MADDLRPCSWPNTAMLVAHEKKKISQFPLTFPSVPSQSSHTPKGVPGGCLGAAGREKPLPGRLLGLPSLASKQVAHSSRTDLLDFDPCIIEEEIDDAAEVRLELQ